MRKDPFNPFAVPAQIKSTPTRASNSFLAPISPDNDDDTNPFPERDDSSHTSLSGEESIENFYPDSSERVVPIPKPSSVKKSRTLLSRLTPAFSSPASNLSVATVSSPTDLNQSSYDQNIGKGAVIASALDSRTKSTLGIKSAIISPATPSANEAMAQELERGRQKIAEFERREKQLQDQQAQRELQLEQERQQLQQQQLQLRQEREEMQKQIQQQEQLKGQQLLSQTGRQQPTKMPSDTRSNVQMTQQQQQSYSPFDEEESPPEGDVYPPQPSPKIARQLIRILGRSKAHY